MAVLAIAVLLWPALHLPRPRVSAPLPFYGQWVSPIQVLFQRPRIWLVVIFILTFKIGEAMLVAMANPFWIDRGFTPKEIGLVVGTLGTLASIGGSLLGGILTARWGILRALWILGAFQAAASLGYMLAALPGSPAFSIYFAALLESLAIGMATAAFLAFLMRLCDKRYSATHYAFLSMLFGLGRSLAGVVGGYSASQMGYPVFFFFTFIVGMAPLFLLSFFKPTLSWVLEEGR